MATVNSTEMAQNPPITKDEIIEEFLVTSNYGVNGRDWPRSTVAACKIICTDEHDNKCVSHQVYRNERPNKHAEKSLIAYLRENAFVLQAKKIEIEVYITYSPCNSCAEKIKKYMEDNKKVRMTIAFANFYKTHEYVKNTKENADSNKEGLKDLSNTGATGVTLQLLEGVGWGTFLDMSQFFDHLTEEEKTECLDRANSDKRKDREEIDKKFWDEILAEEITSKLKSTSLEKTHGN